ncbi:MAG: 50S ribosomal protein L25 [Akkermansiaceae bacterium]|nr:50S ribosomal protein L25 [Akkermansiaceae bacterium]
MAKPQTLQAEERNRTGSGVLKQMRREGFVPSVIYGGGSENRNIKVHAKTLADMLHHAASDSILVNLDVVGVGTQLAFLQDVQHNAISREIVHVDFLAVNENTSIHANLPLELTGEAAGVHAGGLLEQQLHSLEVSCLPKDLPESITAEVTHLQIGDALHIGDMTFPEGVTPSLNDDVVVALVAKTRTAKSEDADGADGEGAATEPEVTSEAATAE